jgi:sulfatase modifying factor 1
MRRPTNPTLRRVSLLVASGTSFLLASLSGVASANVGSSATHAPLSSGCPSDMALVGHTCVDRWEGSLVERHEDGSETPWSAHEVPNGHDVRAVSRPGVTPQAHISMNEAQLACKASGKRLCHAREWKTACRGPENTNFPYGESREANACVDTNRTSPMAVLHNGEHTARTMNDPEANQLPNTVEPTGAAAACTNDYGVYDMVGNVHEWADDGAFHGGYYLDTKLNGPGCEYVTTAHAKNYYDYSTGFRCCTDEGTLDDDSDADDEAPVQARAEEKPAPRPMAHAVGGADGEDDQAPSAIDTNEVSDGDRRSFEPVAMTRVVVKHV